MEPLDSTSPVDLTKAFLEGLHLIDFIFVRLMLVCSAKNIFFGYVRGPEHYQDITGAGFQTSGSMLMLNTRYFLNVRFIALKVHVITFQHSNLLKDHKAKP